MRIEMCGTLSVRSTIAILAGGLLLSLICLVGGAAAATPSAEQTVQMHLPPIDQLPPANATNVRCHVLLPAGLAANGTTAYPSCDQRSGMNLAPQAITTQCNDGCGVMNYSGGPVITSAQSTLIYLNCASTCWGNPSQLLSDFFANSFIHVMDQYMQPSILHTSGRYTVNPTGISLTQSEPHTLVDSQLQTIVLNAVKQQFPSGGGGGYNKMYAIFLPSGQDLCFTAGGQCYCPDSNCGGGTYVFCAYHSSFDSTDAIGNPIHVIYQAMPYEDVNGCTLTDGPNGAVADSENSPLSHEISETITDPDPASGWTRFSDGDEIGDICAYISMQNPIYLNTRAYEIQMEYSNAAQDCVGPFALQATSHNFDGIGVVGPSLYNGGTNYSVNFNSDILWRQNGSGELAMWLMNGGQVLSSASIAQVAGVWSVVGTRDFDGDGNADILWHDTSGDLAIWLMNGATESSGVSLGNVGTQWSVVGTGDFNGDGTGDILWHDGSGDVAIWLMSNGQFSSGISLGNVGTQWSVAGTGDFNGDGTTDILWKDTSGDYAIWLMSNGQFSSGISLGNVGTQWSVVGTGDFSGDGTSDILWKDTSGDYAIWLMNNGNFSSGAIIATGVSGSWSVAETGDFNGDGKSDILWLCTASGSACNQGELGMWLMNGLSVSSTIGLGNVGSTWQVQAANAD